MESTGSLGFMQNKKEDELSAGFIFNLKLSEMVLWVIVLIFLWFRFQFPFRFFQSFYEWELWLFYWRADNGWWTTGIYSWFNLFAFSYIGGYIYIYMLYLGQKWEIPKWLGEPPPDASPGTCKLNSLGNPTLQQQMSMGSKMNIIPPSPHEPSMVRIYV